MSQFAISNFFHWYENEPNLSFPTVVIGNPVSLQTKEKQRHWILD